MFCKKDFLKNFVKFTGKHLCRSIFFNKVAGFRPLTLTQVFSCEFCEIFQRTPQVAASGIYIDSNPFHVNAPFLSSLENVRKPVFLTFSGVVEMEEDVKLLNCCQNIFSVISNNFKVKDIFHSPLCYSPYKVGWWYCQLILIGYAKLFHALNYYIYQMFTVEDEIFY